MSDLLPTMCKDREFARNLIKQMNGEGGRHNSSINTSRVANSDAKDVVKPQQVRAPNHRALENRNRERTATEVRMIESNLTQQINREMTAMRTIGRWKNCYIRSVPESCKIGDAFPFGVRRHDGDMLLVMKPLTDRFWRYESVPTPAEHNVMRFHKVSCEMTKDNGLTFSTEHFWERVE